MFQKCALHTKLLRSKDQSSLTTNAGQRGSEEISKKKVEVVVSPLTSQVL